MLEIIRSKWTAKVLLELSSGTLRFNELRSSMGTISQKMLAQVLRQLEADGLLLRKAYAVIPPRVEYSLTERGLRASEIIRQLELASIWSTSSSVGIPYDPSRGVGREMKDVLRRPAPNI